jgi:hypothetical protein
MRILRLKGANYFSAQIEDQESDRGAEQNAVIFTHPLHTLAE